MCSGLNERRSERRSELRFDAGITIVYRKVPCCPKLNLNELILFKLFKCYVLSIGVLRTRALQARGALHV